MPKLLIYFLYFGLSSCAIGNKFSGTYATNPHTTELNEQIIHFTSDSTLLYISVGKSRTDSISGTYIAKMNYILIQVRCNELHAKWEPPTDSMSLLHTLDIFSKDSIFCGFYLARIPNYAGGNFHGSLFAGSYSSYNRAGYTYIKQKKKSGYYFRYILFKKKR
jgi:hypothetical protein